MTEPSASDNFLTVFSADERVRLGWYRAAVQAGFYTDDLPVEDSIAGELAGELSVTAVPPLTHPFTPAERARLLAYRHAIAAGLYGEEIGTNQTASEPADGAPSLEEGGDQ